MESITLGQVALGIAFFVGIITGIGVISNQMKKWIQQSMQEPLDTIKADIKSINKRIDDVEMNACKNFLVARISEVDKGNKMDDIEAERFWEQYQHYSDIGGNSYIKRKVEQLKAEGKL